MIHYSKVEKKRGNVNRYLNLNKKKFYLWYIFGVNAVDRVADVLLGGHDEREGEHAGGRHAVVQPTGDNNKIGLGTKSPGRTLLFCKEY